MAELIAPAVQEHSPNPHLLAKLVALGDTVPVAASEDVYSATGVKLVSKGSRIDEKLQERLLQHKLRKPLERCMAVDAEPPPLGQLACSLLDQVPGLRGLLGPGAIALLDELSAQIRQGPAATLQLALLQHEGPHPLAHAALKAGIAIELCLRKGCSVEDIRLTGLATLLQDVGELYIDPQLLNPRRPLSPEEWRHVLVHPVLGGRVVRELGELPERVARAIEEHHERCNGCGFPRGLQGDAISFAGKVASISHMLVSLALQQGASLPRIGLALRIIAGEYEPALVALILQEISIAAQPDEAQALPAQLAEDTHRLLHRIGEIVLLLHHCEDVAGTREMRQLVAETSRQFQIIQRAFSSTGLDLEVCDALLLGDAAPVALAQEIRGILDELNWRLRELGMRTALRCAQLSASEQQVLGELCQLLGWSQAREG
ncbi:HD-GYP domain-containing protein [Chitinilyticum piscinae]|uniref:HD domain-containing protein n=1 Tax=Chitinilyticum piscinae TaxID=2866724 RepID=A0A8J7K141_9NEIS|nr:HD domain-containing phosphohydrolase [Chitinilyticum piscinae]MBE9608092.1 HD domain-containing protein [Chitinilyticum piscinae]